MKLFDMREKTFVEALRAFLKEFRLPGEVRSLALFFVKFCTTRPHDRETRSWSRKLSRFIQESLVKNCPRHGPSLRPKRIVHALEGVN